MSLPDRYFLANMLMVFLMLMVSSYNLILNYVAIPKVAMAEPYDLVLYAVWSVLFVLTAFVGGVSLKWKYELDFEEWLDQQVPPLFPDVSYYSFKV